MRFWLETDLKKRTESHETYYNYCGIVKNHLIPIPGKKKMMDVTRRDILKLFNAKAGYSRAVAGLVKTIMNVSFRYTVTGNVSSNSPVDGIGFPKTGGGVKAYGACFMVCGMIKKIFPCCFAHVELQRYAV